MIFTLDDETESIRLEMLPDYQVSEDERQRADGGEMKRKAAADMIEALLQERREAENEKRELQRQIEDIRRQREDLSTELISGGREAAEEMDEKIGSLTHEMQERSRKLKNICLAVRTISAGD